MPTFTTAHYDAQSPTRSNLSRNAPANTTSNDVQFAVIPYVLTSGTDEAAADIIQLCILPAGAVPVPALSSITCDIDPGTAFTVDVGTAADVDGWGDGVALTDKGKIEFCATAHTAPAWLVNTPLVADSGSGNAVVYATVMTATAPVAGAILYFTLAYKRGR